MKRGQYRLAEKRRLAGDDAEPAEGHRCISRLRHLFVKHGLVSLAGEDPSFNTVSLVRHDAQPDVENDAEEPVSAWHQREQFGILGPTAPADLAVGRHQPERLDAVDDGGPAELPAVTVH